MLDTQTNPPTAERMAVVMRDLNAEQDGCTTEALLGHFTPEEIDQHQAEARRLANKLFVRNDEPTKPSREARLRKAITIVSGLMPDIGGITSSLRTIGFSNAELADLWTDLIAGAGGSFIETRGGH